MFRSILIRNLVFVLTIFSFSAFALPHQRVTGTRPRFLDLARRQDFAIPLDDGTVDEDGFFGRLFQEALGGYAHKSNVELQPTPSSDQGDVPTISSAVQLLTEP